MKLKKILPIAIAIVVLISCFTVSTFAASFNRSGVVPSNKINTVSYYANWPNGPGTYWVETQYYNDYFHCIAHEVDNVSWNFTKCYWWFTVPYEYFNFDPFETYTLRFDLRNWLRREYDYDYSLEIQIEDLSYSTTIVKGAPDLLYFEVTLTPEWFAKILPTIGSVLNFHVFFDFPVDHPITYDPVLSISAFEFSCKTAEETAIDNATAQITGGWTADPKNPDGSEKVDQQTQLEDQIMNDTAAGRQETNEILNTAPSIIGNYTDGFLFLMGLFGLATDITFIDNLLGLSLTFGLFVFFFNLVPSVAAKVTRNEIRNERQQRHSKK